MKMSREMAFTTLPSTLDYAPYYAVALIVISLLLRKKWAPKLPLPPGPKGLPLIGNLRDVPRKQEWLTYARWGRECNSDIIRLNLAGANVLVVNTQDAAFELFDRRSAIYSDRPRFPMLMELIKWNWPFNFFSYGHKWRSYRKLFHQFFNMNAVENYHPHQLKATHELLQRLATEPEKFMNHVQLLAASLILNITYGIDAQSLDNEYVINAEKAMSIMAEAGTPGDFLVDAVPILQYVPDWMPGTEFKAKAKVWHEYVKDSAYVPLKYVKDQMSKGDHVQSVASQCLTNMEQYSDKEAEESRIRDVTAIAYVGGSDTTVSAIWSLFLGMALHPEFLRKAQQELDDVCHDRLPEFSDRASLPYVAAVVREVLRWHPVTPLGFAHRLMVDDVYNGMFLPGGSTVIGNTWAMLHDERAYGPDVESFNPERFLKDGELNPDVKSPDVAFGFGRRVCPGRHLVADSMFITVASILACFDISKAVDEKGNPITPVEEYASGVISHPKPFKCAIKPRSGRALGLVNEAYAVHHP